MLPNHNQKNTRRGLVLRAFFPLHRGGVRGTLLVSSKRKASSQQTPRKARPDSYREKVGLCRGRQEEKQAHTLESKGRADPAYGGVTVTPTETGKHLSRTRSRRPRPVTPKSGNGGARRLTTDIWYLIGSGDQQYRLHTLTACVVSGGGLRPE